MKRIAIVLVLVQMCFVGVAQNGISNVLMQKQGFYEARLELESMLAGDEPLDYERAVFVMENAYRGNSISYEAYEAVLDYHTENIRLLAEANRNEEGMDFSDDMARFETGEEKRENYENLLYNWAIHHYLTDTTIIRVDGEEFVHLPCAYSYDDPMAVLDWEHSQVFNLLDNKTGNCYAMASLFKIFAERFGTDAEICTAPGHVFIVHDDLDGRGYNLELANGGFPGLGTIMTVTYTPVEAVRSGISIRELDEKQSVALCLVYLGKSYEYRFGTKTDGFIYECAETALGYDSLNLNAMLLKAGVLGERLCSTEKNVSQLQNDSEFMEYEALIVSLYEKGYREMPLDMKNLIVNRLKRDSIGLVLVDHTPTSFKSFDAKNERYATLSWGLFDEEHAPKDVEKYGRALLDTKTKKIVGLVEHDVLYNGYPLDVGVFGWAIDPLGAKYPNMSPYMAFGNNPIYFIDTDGRVIRIWYIDDDGNEASMDYKPGMEVPNQGFLKSTVEALNYVYNGSSIAAKDIDYAVSTDEVVHIKETSGETCFYDDTDENLNESKNYNHLFWNSKVALETVKRKEFIEKPKGRRIGTGMIQTPALGLYHDLLHFVHAARDQESKDYLETVTTDAYTNLEEKRTIRREKRVAKQLGEPWRNNHGGIERIVSKSTSIEINSKLDSKQRKSNKSNSGSMNR
jgi:hypothetical protein